MDWTKLKPEGSSKKLDYRKKFSQLINFLSCRQLNNLGELSRGESEQIWRILKQVERECFTFDAELEALKLAIRFCCYYSNGFHDPELNMSLSKRDYYSLAQKISKQARPNFGRFNLSSLIRDQEFSTLLELK